MSKECNHEFKFMNDGHYCIICNVRLKHIERDRAVEEIIKVLEGWIGLTRSNWTLDIKDNDIFPMIDYIGNRCKAVGEAEKEPS